MNGSKVTVAAHGDRELIITRQFDAPRVLVFRAHTECSYLKRWMYGPDGWSLAECEIDLKVGGRYRWVWRKEDKGIEMGAGGEYRAIESPARLVCTEKFDDPWYPGEAISTLTLTEADGRTTLINTMTYESGSARDTVLASPMEEGLGLGYDRLENLLKEDSTAAASRS